MVGFALILLPPGCPRLGNAQNLGTTSGTPFPYDLLRPYIPCPRLRRGPSHLELFMASARRGGIIYLDPQILACGHPLLLFRIFWFQRICLQAQPGPDMIPTDDQSQYDITRSRYVRFPVFGYVHYDLLPLVSLHPLFRLSCLSCI